MRIPLMALGLVLASCGGPPEPADPGGPDSDAPADLAAAEPPVTEIGKSPFTPAVQALVAESKGGGFRPPPPLGSTCPPGAERYSLTTATRIVDWRRCIGSDTQPYQEQTGTRALTEAEYADLGAALSKLLIVKEGPCGADKPVYVLWVKTAGGEQEYGDSFYGCQNKDKPLVDSGTLGQVLTKLRGLVSA